MLMRNLHRAITKDRIIDFSIVALLSAIFIYLNVNYIAPLKSLPSPVFGGDYYYQMGAIEHLRDGGGFIASSSLTKAMPTYLPIYGWLVAVFSNIFGLSTFKGMLIFSFISGIFSYLLWFWLMRSLFGDRWLAAVGTIMANGIWVFIIKYTPFSFHIFMPIFLLLLYRVYEKNNLKAWALLGLVYGLGSLAHAVLFMGQTLLIALFLTFILLREFSRDKLNGIAVQFKASYKNWALFFLISIPLFMVYWYQPVFIYRLHMPYPRGKLDFADLSLFSNQISTLVSLIKSYFFNFSNLSKATISVLSLIGIFSLFLVKLKEKKFTQIQSFLKWYAIASFLAVFSYFITEPLIGMNFIPSYMAYFLFGTLVPLLSLFTIFILGKLSQSLFTLRIRGIEFNLLAIIFFLLLASSVYVSFFKTKMNDRWYANGKLPFPQIYKDLGEFLKKNSDVDDVILTTKELGFAVNAFSGRKLVTGRWAHNGDPYTDLPLRDAEAAVILYGANQEARIQLLKKYHVKFLYWDSYWVHSEFNVNEKGEVVDFFDPMLTFNQPKYRLLWDSNNVSYLPMKYWLDPTAKKEEVKRFDILVASPANYHNFSAPWHPGLHKLLTPIWAFTENNVTHAVLYKVRINEG